MHEAAVPYHKFKCYEVGITSTFRLMTNYSSLLRKVMALVMFRKIKNTYDAFILKIGTTQPPMNHIIRYYSTK